MRAEEVAELLDVKGVMDGQTFLGLVRGGSASAQALGDYPWLPPGLTTLEGYLFPDTYRLPSSATPADLVRRMLDNFEFRVTDRCPDRRRSKRAAAWSRSSTWPPSSSARRRWPTTGRWSPASTGIASLALCTRRRAATIFRPTHGAVRGRPPRPMVVEAALGRGVSDRSVAIQHVSAAGPAAERPSPAPAFRPSQAAADPASTQYCFFVAAGDGAHVFATTLAEHEANIARYQK